MVGRESELIKGAADFGRKNASVYGAFRGVMECGGPRT